MELKQLRYFVAAARRQNITAAAIDLRLTQPALSRQIRALEQEIGLALFEREGRGSNLTEHGRRLLQHAEALLDHESRIKEELRDQPDRTAGAVTLGITSGAGDIILPPLMERYRSRYPAVMVRVHQAFSGTVEEWVRNRAVDLAVLPTLAPLQLNAEIIPLFEQDLCLIGRISQPLAGQTSCRLQAVRELPLILPAQPHTVRTLVEQIAARQAIPLNVCVEVDGMEAIRGMLRRGLGYTILPYHPFHRDVLGGDLQAVPIVDPWLKWRFSLVVQKRVHSTRAVAAMVDVLRQLLDDLVHTGAWQHTTLLSQNMVQSG